MLNALKRWISQLENPDAQEREVAVHVASAALLVQLSGIDNSVDPRETQVIRHHIDNIANQLSGQDLDELVSEASQMAADSTSLFEFTRRINDSCSQEEKQQIILDLWRVAWADDHLDKYEEHYVRRAADLLYVHHSDFMRLKLQARAERKNP